MILKLGKVVNTAFPLFYDAPHLTTSKKILEIVLIASKIQFLVWLWQDIKC